MARRPTIRDLAEAAGVSVATVDRVLNGRHPVREETARQILRIQDAWQEALAASGGPFLFGRFSIADAMFGPVVSRFITYGVQMPAAVSDYMDRVMALPAMKTWAKGAKEEVDAGIA